MSEKIKTSAGLQGLTRLLTDATLGVTDLVEAMHNRVTHPPYLPSTQAQQLVSLIAELTFKNIKWSTRLIGGGVDKALGKLSSVLGEIKATKERDAFRSILNGVIGDYLEETKNPLRINMQFRHKGKSIFVDPKSLEEIYPALNGKILLMVHGACLNDTHWTRNEHNHGEALAAEGNKTLIYLHYNSGRHISTNGQEFNLHVEKMLTLWPVPIEEITIVAHSMGGLITRSAIHYGEQGRMQWIRHLKKVVFLGTPHHGAPLERIGNYLDNILEAIPYAKPFARIGKVRSAGVTDLRFGNLIDEDWQENDRFEIHGDRSRSIALPKHIELYCVAGSIGKTTDSLSTRVIGDKMVSIKSALGIHKDPLRNLDFKKENTWISLESTHSDLLSKKKIYKKLKEWLID